MIEIRIHGRGGQGGVTAAEVLAVAAFKDGKQSQAFPFIGTEIRGASVEAYCRISDEEIKIREHVYNPDYVLLLDPSLFDPKILEGMSDGSILIINSPNEPKDFNTGSSKIKVLTLDLTKIALETIGKPFVNMPMIGAFIAVYGKIPLKSVAEAVYERFEKEVAKANVKAIEKAYEEMKRIGRI